MPDTGPEILALGYEIDGDVIIFHQGTVSDAKDLSRGLVRAMSDPAAQDQSHLLWDARQAPANASAEKIYSFAAQIKQTNLSGKIAFLVANELQFGVSRMASVYGRDFDSNIAVFYDQTEAMNWLRSDSD